MRVRVWIAAVSIAVSGVVSGRVSAADTPETEYLLPSAVSELQFVYAALRVAARRGDMATFREHYDPATMRTTYRDRNGRRRRVGPRWLRAHAYEWPAVGTWEVAEARGYREWARLTFRHPHMVENAPDGRWDFYFLQYRNLEGHWRLTRRAIATFGTPGPLGAAPRVEDLPLVPVFALPPQAWAAAPGPPGAAAE